MRKIRYGALSLREAGRTCAHRTQRGRTRARARGTKSRNLAPRVIVYADGTCAQVPTEMQEAFEAKYGGDNDFLHGGMMMERIEQKCSLYSLDGKPKIKKMCDGTTRGGTCSVS